MNTINVLTKHGAHPTSPDILLGQKITNFKDWICSAGVNYLFVDWDGNVFPAMCQLHLSKPLGNIFQNSPLPNQTWMVCNRMDCICAAEVELPKFRSTVDRLNWRGGGHAESAIPFEAIVPDDFLGIEGRGEVGKQKTVMWALGRRCNYACTYCDDFANSKTEALKKLDSYSQALDKILNYFSKDEKLSFFLMGGEPTIFPGYLELCQKIASAGHTVNTITNASRNLEYLTELKKYSHLGISVHFESINDLEFFKKMKALARQKSYETHPTTIDIKLMATPENFQRALKLGKKLAPLQNPLFSIRMVNMRKKNMPDLMDYSDDQQKATEYFNQQRASQIFEDSFLHLVSRKVVTFFQRP